MASEVIFVLMILAKSAMTRDCWADLVWIGHIKMVEQKHLQLVCVTVCVCVYWPRVTTNAYPQPLVSHLWIGFLDFEFGPFNEPFIF